MSFNAGKIAVLSLWLVSSVLAGGEDSFRRHVAPILERHCLRCHQGKGAKGDVDLTSESTVVEGRGEGWLVVPGKPDESDLLKVIAGEKPRMPKSGERLTKQEIARLRKWIKEGAAWPDNLVLKFDPLNWWSLRALARPRLPDLTAEGQGWARAPIDLFVFEKLREMGMTPSPEADRRTLIRRVSFDLTGLPPSFEDVERFARDEDPQAYERLVDRLLDSPQYGQRWARHWLDAVHYGDTHGYDKDKVRPHAWPYRDYVIRSLNEDKPYSRFVKEQLAGDAFYPGTADGTLGLGFIAAGPFDYVGQIEVKNGTLEKKRVRNIDRDDMVSVTMNTFVSLTVHCARCHDHKFDPITQEDYYRLQAVFAAVDRADRPYDEDPEVASRRQSLQEIQRKFASRKSAIEERIQKRAGPKLRAIDRRLAELTKQATAAPRPEYGYHSQIMPGPDHAKWVQVDLGKSLPIGEITLVAAYDDFAGIGAGFGFPVRYKLEISDDAEFQKRVAVVADKALEDVPNPGVVPQTFSLQGKSARYVRLTATRLRERRKDYIFALAELKVLAPRERISRWVPKSRRSIPSKPRCGGGKRIWWTASIAEPRSKKSSPS